MSGGAKAKKNCPANVSFHDFYGVLGKIFRKFAETFAIAKKRQFSWIELETEARCAPSVRG